MNNSLEKELERRGKLDPEAKGLWHQYNAVKGYLSKEYYPWVQANCPYFTDHGELHIGSVILTAGHLVSRRLKCKGSERINSVDIYIILSAILWHDVAMVHGRTNHAQRVGEISEEIKKLAFPNPDFHRIITQISKAHAGNGQDEGLNIPKSEEDCTVTEIYTVFPKALAAVVRFADEISENHNRISQALLSKVPNENKIFWEYASCISASRPEPERERVVITYTIPHDKVIEEFTCVEFPNHCNANGKISLIQYIICRLEKINNEREYCSREFSNYTKIRQIHARFRITKGVQLLKNYELEIIFSDSGLQGTKYPQIDIFEKFFAENPKWQPNNIKEALAP